MFLLQVVELSKVISPQRPHATMFHSLMSHTVFTILMYKCIANLWM